jgi:hypothetical protein
MKGYSERKRPHKRTYDVYLLVCEGSKTERIYFNRFRTRRNNLRIITPDSKFTDPENLVDFAIRQKHELELDVNSGDRVWCVFDTDENTDRAIRNAVKRAKSNGIEIALSNPCFEIWYLIHFCDWTKSSSVKEVNEELKDRLPRYSKSEDVFDELEPKRAEAIRRAINLVRMHSRNKRTEFDMKSNPCTSVHHVVNSILTHKK